MDANEQVDDLAEKVRRIEIRARRMVREQTAGAWHAAFKGQGIEFAEVREFQEGDELRAIDWNLTARMGRPFVKRFTEEREQRVHLLVDGSASGHTASGPQPRAERIAEIAAVLALSATLNKDRVGMTLFADHDELHLEASRSRHHVLRMIREVMAHRPARAGTDLGGCIQRWMQSSPKRSVVFILSDLLDTSFEEPLRYLALRHDVTVLHLSDPLERAWPRLPFGMAVQLEGLESPRRTGLNRRRAKRLATTAAERGKTLSATVRRMGADWIDVDTVDDYLPALLHYFRNRGARR